ncbi:MAG TPA: TPM domain-containing protein, partial [Thermoanaerobaculia bacterium]
MTTNPRPESRSAVPLALFLLLLFLTALAPAAGALSPEEVPSPLPGGWVTDLAGTLPPDALDALNREADRVHAEGRGQLAVAVVPATDDGDPFGFALRLFDHWGVGDAERNDGVLLFLSVGDRAAEIVLGAGVDDPRRQAASDRIMQSVMVPRFRQGDLAGGLVDGAR